MSTVYYTASSVDGFIADPDQTLSWLLSRDIDPAGPTGLDGFLAGVGAMVMGAVTYRWILDHLEAWPYPQPAWVLTHHDDLPVPPGADVRFTGGSIPRLHRDVTAAAGDRDSWLVGGGELVGQFADAGLLDELVVQFAPVTLGAGVPILPRRLELRLLDLGRNRDFACARYEVVRDG